MLAELGVLRSQATLRMEPLSLNEEGIGGIRLNKTEHLCEIQNLVFIDTSRCTSFLLYGCCVKILRDFSIGGLSLPTSGLCLVGAFSTHGSWQPNPFRSHC